jgi:hypothetical protein
MLDRLVREQLATLAATPLDELAGAAELAA